MILVLAAGLVLFILGVGTEGTEGWILTLVGGLLMGVSLSALTSRDGRR